MMYSFVLCLIKKNILWTVLKGYKVYGRTGAGAGIFVRTDFFSVKNQGMKLTLSLPPPPPPPIIFVSSRVTVAVQTFHDLILNVAVLDHPKLVLIFLMWSVSIKIKVSLPLGIEEKQQVLR